MLWHSLLSPSESVDFVFENSQFYSILESTVGTSDVASEVKWSSRISGGEFKQAISKRFRWKIGILAVNTNSPDLFGKAAAWSPSSQV